MMIHCKTAISHAVRSMSLILGLLFGTAGGATAETYVCNITKIHKQHAYLPQSFTFSTFERGQAVKLDSLELEGFETIPSFPELVFRDRRKLRFSWPGTGYEPTGALPENHLRQDSGDVEIYDFGYHVSFRRDTLAFSVDVRVRNGSGVNGNATGRCGLSRG